MYMYLSQLPIFYFLEGGGGTWGKGGSEGVGFFLEFFLEREGREGLILLKAMYVQYICIYGVPPYGI